MRLLKIILFPKMNYNKIKHIIPMFNNTIYKNHIIPRKFVKRSYKIYKKILGTISHKIVKDKGIYNII
jgi:hypothetical protein